jgi:hypothetical protein
LLRPCHPSRGAGSARPREDALTKRVVSELEVFTSWLRANNARGFIGEVGWPEGGSWNELAERWYADADASELWVTAWAPRSATRGGAVTEVL